MNHRELIRQWLKDQGYTQTAAVETMGCSQGNLNHFLAGRSWSKIVVDGLRELGCPEEYLQDPKTPCAGCQRLCMPGVLNADGLCKRCLPREKASKIDGVETRLALRDPWAEGTFQGPYGVHVNDILVCPWR